MNIPCRRHVTHPDLEVCWAKLIKIEINSLFFFFLKLPRIHMNKRFQMSDGQKSEFQRKTYPSQLHKSSRWLGKELFEKKV